MPRQGRTATHRKTGSENNVLDLPGKAQRPPSAKNPAAGIVAGLTFHQGTLDEKEGVMG